MMKKRERHVVKTWVQIFLLISASFAFAYILNQNLESYRGEDYKRDNRNFIRNRLLFVLQIAIKLIFNDKNFVSALEGSDLSNGVATCFIGKDKSLCQEYPASECNDKCSEECFPSPRKDTAECKIGTCYDPDFGTCQEGSPKLKCENNGGQWFDDPAGNVPICKKACCVVGDEVSPLVTGRECAKISEVSGIKTEYKPEIRDELQCLALARTQAEGACVFGAEDTKACKFITKGECLNNGGEFFEGFLCSYPELKMDYKKQADAKCIEDKLYWVDNMGNKENIYDANKVKSWNNGKVLSEENNCVIWNSADELANQKTCGNCNRFRGSVCGQKTSNEKLSDSSIDFICKDIRCVDKNGNIRENEESWCEYQGQIGAEENGDKFIKSKDTPGSRHFRMTCVDGEIITNPCEDYRNEICIEEKNKRDDGKEISSSACVKNLWQLCIEYNTKFQDDLQKRNNECVKNPLCAIKSVDIDKSFKFDFCVPKYSPGFDLRKNAEGGEISCTFASQKCTVFFVKEIDGWKAKVNKGCLNKKFAEQMNDLCMSLGDCGASVNYMGELSQSYRVQNSPGLDNGYLSGIGKYSEPKAGEFAKINVSAYLVVIGAIVENKDFVPGTEDLNTAGQIAGYTGSGLLLIAGTNWAAVHPLILTQTISISTAAFAGALAGAAIGFAVTALLIKATGIGSGLDPAIVWTLVAAGTLGGAIVGAAVVSSVAAGTGIAGGLFGTTTILGATLAFGPIGLIILVVVVIVIVIFKALGIGDTKKKIVSFQCFPWQAQLGGDKCSECGKDGYPCSKYACQSLGQTCELINEGAGAPDEKCVDISPNDFSAPKIEPLDEALSEGYKYADISDNGFKIESSEGCIAANKLFSFGVKLNEPGQCRYDAEHTKNYDEMEFEFGARNLFLENHTQIFRVPSLSSLGLSENDPNVKGELNLYVRCIDKKGNTKDSAEKVINFCIKRGEDKTPPIITWRLPVREEVAFNTNELNASIFTDDPAECRWSATAGQDYDSMTNNFECANDFADQELLGFKCDAKFSLDKEENKFYVRCKDQPWYGLGWEGEGSENIKPDESKRNKMPNDYEFVAKKTKTELKIDYMKPNNETLEFGISPASVWIEVKTSGGLNDKATCSILSGSRYAEMAETFGTTHKQRINVFNEGEYAYKIKCADLVGNTAETELKFNVNIDADAPKITRVYDNAKNLIVITDENAECSYVKNLGIVKDLCSFEFENGTLMSGNEKLHSTGFDKSVYYIKCKDEFANIAGDCSVIVRGG